MAVIIWLDSGRDLSHGPAGPWTEPLNHRHASGTYLYPVIQHRPWMALEQDSVSVPLEDANEKASNLSQSASILDLAYGRNLEAKLMAADPFYAISELLQFVAYSKCQFLNGVEKKLVSDSNSILTSRTGSKDSSSVLSLGRLTLSNLLYYRNRLEDSVDRIRGSLGYIKNRVGPEWSGTLEGDQKLKVDAVAASLVQDYEYLLQRAESLAVRCHQGLGVIMNDAVVAESKEAIKQSKEVAKLTRLAYFFIPLSFTASFLGMNVLQFGNGTVELWVWFAVTVPVFVLSVLLLYLDATKLVKPSLRWMSQLSEAALGS